MDGAVIDALLEGGKFRAQSRQGIGKQEHGGTAGWTGFGFHREQAVGIRRDGGCPAAGKGSRTCEDGDLAVLDLELHSLLLLHEASALRRSGMPGSCGNACVLLVFGLALGDEIQPG